MADAPEYEPRQLLLMELRDKLCRGNAAELAREIGKDGTYVHRLLYPVGKSGRKGIGLEIMAATARAFFLPAGFWDSEPPALDDKAVATIKQLRALRNRVYHGMATAEETTLFQSIEAGHRARAERIERHTAALQEMYERNAERNAERTADAAGRLARYTGEEAAPSQFPTMQPILAWEYEEDLPEGEYVFLPRLAVNLSAGGGKEQVEIELVKKQPQAFRADWIREEHLKPRMLAVMKVDGESMEPRLPHGDAVVVDTSQTEVKDDRVYALWYDGGERIKRLYRMPGGGLRIHSDNRDKDKYPDITLKPEELDTVRIIGRVVHTGGRGGL